MENTFEVKYREILFQYLEHQDEEILYSCEKLTREAMENQISPEEIVNLHRSVLEEYDVEIPPYIKLSFDVLLETMVGYGLAYLEHQSLRTEQKVLKNEIAQAETLQKTMMKSEVPVLDNVDFGVTSVAARQMSGDYYSFTEPTPLGVGVALADVIGKGIPAAFTISMIKYALAGIVETTPQPNIVLETLNQVAEENMDDNMFITMFYGLYEPEKHLFQYSSAGHELGLYYRDESQKFSDLYAKGLPLGVNSDAKYRTFSKHIHAGDILFIMSDGVTEARTADGFLDREALIDIFSEFVDLPAQKIAEAVYNKLIKLQNFELHDDFTIICIKRTK